jgi:hypothetical protein
MKGTGRTTRTGLYFYCYCFLTLPDGTAGFAAFRRMPDNAGQQFPEEELRLLYLLAVASRPSHFFQYLYLISELSLFN